MRQARGKVLGIESYALQEFMGSTARLAWSQFAVVQERREDAVPDGAPRIERQRSCPGILPAVRRESVARIRRAGSQRGILDSGAYPPWPESAQQDSTQRGFARAGLAYQSDGLAFAQRQRYAIDGAQIRMAAKEPQPHTENP